MSWPAFSLQYRYTVFAALIAVVVLGIYARVELPVRLFPDTDPPVVTVITPYPGAAASDVAKAVSKLLEEEIAGIDGTAKVSSTSQTGLSVVKAEFHYTRNVETAAVDVQNAISRIRTTLPNEIGEPQVLQFSSADKPILTVALGSESLTLDDVRELADNAIKDRLQMLAGVAAVDVFGGHKRQLEIALQRDRLAAYAVEADTVIAVLKAWNLMASGGRVERGAQEAVVRFYAPLEEPQDVEALVVQQQGDRTVRIGDVADVRLATKEARSAYRYNGRDAIAVQVMKRDEANTVVVAGLVRGALDELSVSQPDIQFAIADDDSVFTELVIANMTTSVMMAIALTIFVVFLFLADFRQAAIIALSIPIAFLATFALMQLVGIDLNMVTMSAVILSIGLLVDDSIVVIENIARHLGEGKTRVQAALQGTEEIFLADLSGTVTTMAVLVPLLFLGGFVGKLFGPLAWTVLFALAASFVVSVTLIPLLAALWMLPADNKTRHSRWRAGFHNGLDALRQQYLQLLQWGIRHPWRLLGTAVILLVLSARVMGWVGSEMLPKFDSGSFEVSIDMAPGTPLEITQEAVARTETLLLAEPSVTDVSSQIGYEAGGHFLGSRGAMDTNQAQITVTLTARTERDRTIWDVMAEVRSALSQYPGVVLAITREKGGTARSTTAAPIDVRLSGRDPEVLDVLAREVLVRISAIPGLVNPYANWLVDTPEVHFNVDRIRAAELGLTGQQVADAVYRAMEGSAVTPYRQPYDRDLDVFVRYIESDRLDLQALENIMLPTVHGVSVPVREVADLAWRLGPRIVTREDYRQTLDVLGFTRGRPLSQVIGDVRAALEELALPAGYEFDITGEQADFETARSSMLRALAFGIFAVYLVLVAQFRSFSHPATIMVAIPLQFVGVSLALLVAGKYLSMPALLGIILLTGTVVNNSIVLIDYMLQRLRGGATIDEAVAESVAVRFRPIMMTALSDVAGMLPLALELAVGAERFSPIATVVIGGILAATLLTLVVIPVLFRLIAAAQQRRHGVDVFSQDEALLAEPRQA